MTTPPCVELSREAIRGCAQLVAERPEWQGLPLRLYIEGKDCDGFTYGACFDAPATGDVELRRPEWGAVWIVLDADSARYMQQLDVTFVDDHRGRGFLIVNHDQDRYRGKFYAQQASSPEGEFRSADKER